MAKQKPIPPRIVTEPIFKCGDCVGILHSGSQRGRIVELRGPLGPGGAQIYRVRIRGMSKPNAYVEVREDQLKLLPPKNKEDVFTMTVEAPLEFVETLATLRFPEKTNLHLQHLMDGNTAGSLTGAEREELEALVELSERMALLRTQALRLLGRTPT